MRINYQNFERDIIANAKLHSIPNMDWEDIAQELRIHLWLKRDKYQPKRASIRTFVIRILKNKVKDLQKAAFRQKRKIDSFHINFSQIEIRDGNLDKLDLAIPII